MELREYLRILRQSWVLIVSMVVLGVIISGTYSA